jgi:hypothetical protein
MENNITESIQLMANKTTQFKTADGKILAYYTLPEQEPEQPRDLVKELNQIIKESKDV